MMITSDDDGERRTKKPTIEHVNRKQEIYLRNITYSISWHPVNPRRRNIANVSKIRIAVVAKELYAVAWPRT